MKKNLLVPLLVLFFAYYLYENFIRVRLGDIIETKSGRIQGIVSKSRDGREFQSWLGIPYAEPPIGDLRFSSPVPVKRWEGVRDGSYYGNACPQVQIFSELIVGNEDCLHLNVFAPKEDNSTSAERPLLPVMIYIHGGAFIWFSSYEFPASYFMDQDVLLVTLNYRLNVFGFLSTGDENIRGNMGLKDQMQAIKWVKENIAAFGGDPSNILVFGDSAGSVSTHLMSISNKTRGLFHKAILMSGTATVPWGVRSTKEAIEQTKGLAHDLNCPTNNNKELTACLRQLSTYEIAKAYAKDSESIQLMNPVGFGYIAGPTIEAVDDDEAFLTRHPMDVMKAGQAQRIPMIAGVTKDEGLLSALQFYNEEESLEEFEDNFEECIEKSFGSWVNVNGTAKKLWEFYFPGKFEDRANSTMDRDEKIKRYRDMFSDGHFLNGVRELAHIQRELSPQLFMYYYDYVGPSNQFFLVEFKRNRYHFILEGILGFGKFLFYDYIVGNVPHRYGVHHSDSTHLYFDLLLPKSSISDHALSRDLVKLWVDFAYSEKTYDLEIRGTKFTPIGKEGPLQYLTINQNPKMISEPNPERAEFWKSIKA